MASETAIARVLRSKSRATVATRPGYRGAVGSIQASDRKGLFGRLVRVRGLNKAQRKAWHHWLAKKGMSYLPVERHATNGIRFTRATRAETGCTAYMVWGGASAMLALTLHGFVVEIEQARYGTDRCKAKMGPPKRPVRPGPKHKRPAGTRFVAVRSEFTEDGPRAVWEQQTARK